MGFVFGFEMFSIMFTLAFVLVFGIFIVTAIRGIGQWNKNNNSPRLTVPFKKLNFFTAHWLCKEM